MAAAFLFDPSLQSGHYGEWVLAITLASGLPQRAHEYVHIRDGDLLWYTARQEPALVGKRLDATNTMPGLLRDSLASTLGRRRTHVVYFPDLDDVLARELHAYLLRETHYMGCYGVNQSLGLHYVLFDCKLSLNCRISGDECLVRYSESIGVVQDLKLFRSVLHAPTDGETFFVQSSQEASHQI